MLEVDEEQHRFYKGGISCDMKRMSYIMRGLAIGGNELPVLFIRYNPHSFKIDYEKQKGLPKKEREQILIQFIKDYKSPGEGLDIAYMYYDYETDGDDVNLVVTNSNEYHPQMKECVRHIIRYKKIDPFFNDYKRYKNGSCSQNQWLLSMFCNLCPL